jgi:exodeoxyribonuclease V alpha subunit
MLLDTHVPNQAADGQAVRMDVERCRVGVRQVIFLNDENGYAVVKVQRLEEKNTTFVACGIFGEVAQNVQYVISGNWSKTNYGEQLSVTTIETPEAGIDGILAYLSDGHVKGIGKRLAKRIVEEFGEETSRVLTHAPERLLGVKGINKDKLDVISKSWDAVAGRRNALITLRGLGLTHGTAVRILQKYQMPSLAMKVVHEDPYALSWEVKGIGFIEADRIAGILGHSKDAPERSEAAVGYALRLGLERGHCYLSLAELRDSLHNAKKFHGFQHITISDIQNICQKLERARKVTVATQERIYLHNVFASEVSVAYDLARLAGGTSPRTDNLPKKIQDFEKKQKIALHELQKEAVQTAVSGKVSIVTGGPGTGKTTLIKAILEVYWTKRVALCATTGRAAKRMMESTGVDAKTIHRLLEFNPQEGFNYNQDNRLPYDFVIVDESSMLDIFLAKALICALEDHCRLVMVGDIDQLPPVGAGQVFADMIRTGLFPVARLQRVYRQSPGSYIALNAQAIRDGKSQSINLTNRTDDFFWMPVDGMGCDSAALQNLTRHRLLKAMNRLREQGYALSDIQILTPMKAGELGVEALNKVIQQEYNGGGAPVYTGKNVQYRLDDIVMQCRNNYDNDVYNGDIGRITAKTGKGFEVTFDGKAVEYTKDNMLELMLAYALTVHKAQGGEHQVIIQIISKSHYVMLHRAILYTGVTRAREKCILIGEKSALNICVKNNKLSIRNTGLLGMLTENLVQKTA